jgi:RND family efflux transporter MFP subunit
MKMGNRDHWWWLVVVSSCLAACSPQTPVRTAEVRPVKTMVVGPAPDTYVRVFPGKVEASKNVALTFQVPGIVVLLPVKEGQRLSKGQIVAQLRQDEFQARRRAAQGQVEQARATLAALKLGERPEEQLRREAQLRATEAKLANSKTEFERYTRLLPNGSVSRAEYELAETAYHVAQEEHKSAKQLVEKGSVARREDIDAQEGFVRTLEARLAEADVQLADSTLRTPYDGTVGQRMIEQGQVVAPNKAVVEFQNTDDIDIVVAVPEAAMVGGFRQPNIAQMEAEVSAAQGNRFPVRMKEIAQVADPVTQTFQVRFTAKAPRRVTVLPGMTAVVTLMYRRPGPADNRIFVPVSAVFKQDTGDQVIWVVGPDDTVRCRTVKLDGAKDGELAVIDGLNRGDRIAVAGAPFLRDGMKVRDLGDALGGLAR